MLFKFTHGDAVKIFHSKFLGHNAFRMSCTLNIIVNDITLLPIWFLLKYLACFSAPNLIGYSLAYITAIFPNFKISKQYLQIIMQVEHCYQMQSSEANCSTFS